MKTLKFKTNIRCSGCIAVITPYLDKLPEIGYWVVDTTTREQILPIESELLQAGEVIAALKSAGYKAEQI